MTEPTARTWEQLLAAPPPAFVKERNAIAATLKKEGHAAAARAVLRLRKPSATLWATNRLARTETKRLAAFLESVESVRKAQLRDPRATATAIRQQRAQLEELVRRAGELLEAQGHRATPATHRRISNTLLGAAVDRKLVEELRHGRLSVEPSAPGFEVLTGAPSGQHLRVVRGPQAPPRVTPKSDEDRFAEIEERARRQREADELARTAAARQQTAERQRREVEDLARDLAAARERLRAARRAAKTAAAAARRARHIRP